MTRLPFIALPALIALGACAVAPPEETAASEDGLTACSRATTATFHEYFEECRIGNEWIMCGAAGPGADGYFMDFAPRDREVACDNFCQSVHGTCSAYSANGTLGFRQIWQENFPGTFNKRKRGYSTKCTCKELPAAVDPQRSPVFSVDGHVYYQNMTGHYCHFPDPSYVTGLAPGEPVVNLPSMPPTASIHDGYCHPTNRAFQTGGGIFYENDSRHYCHFTTMESYQNYLNNGGPPAVQLDQLPPGAIFDGACQ
jgi:hypothetical protein